jgi:peptide/nickel transport system substrate-binding protein
MEKVLEATSRLRRKAMQKGIGGLVTVLFLVAAMLFPAEPFAAPAKKLIIAVGQEPSSLDPSLAFGAASQVTVENWGEYLLYRAPSGKLGPGLASSWKMSLDGKEIDFILRKGVKFHSGDLLTAKDVVFSFERAREKNSTVKTRRFKIHFKAPDVTFIPNRCAFVIVSKSYYDRVSEDKFVKEPVGTGPYKVVGHMPGEYVDIERFEDYWGEKPSVKEARFLFVAEETTRSAKLKAGEVDLLTGCPYPSVKDIEKTPGLKTLKLATNHPSPSILFSTRNPNTPWHDRRVRLAMAYAIDCDAIIKNVLQGIPNRYAFLAPYELGYDPAVKPYPYDPKKAKELLAEAGYPKGFEFKLYWIITGYAPMMREVAEAIASYFEAVGIRTKLVAQEYSAWYATFRASKGPEAEYVAYWLGGRAGSVEPAYNLDLFFGSEGGFSIYSNPELDKIIAQTKATVDNTKRGELIKKAVKIIQEEVPTILIFNTVAVYAMKNNIDFKPTQNYFVDLALVKDMTIK